MNLFSSTSRKCNFTCCSKGMEKKEACVMSAGIIVCLAFTGLVDGTVNAKCRKSPCDKENFDVGIYEQCVLPFNQTMATFNYQLKCPWPATRRYYINLILCMEKQANISCCVQVSYRHKVLLEIHQLYFSLCSYMKDPEWYILLLLIVPCIIITLMVPFICQKFRLHEYKLPKDRY